LKVLRKKAAVTRNETEKKQIEADIQSLNSHVEELLASLEKIATGGALQQLAEEQEATAFDWHSEIEDLFKPLVYELKRLTERPRRFELLRTRQSLLEGRLIVVDDALGNIARPVPAAPHSRNGWTAFHMRLHMPPRWLGTSRPRATATIRPRLRLLGTTRPRFALHGALRRNLQSDLFVVFQGSGMYGRRQAIKHAFFSDSLQNRCVLSQ
jgi:hypothetical protein